MVEIMESDETVLSDVHLFTDNLNNEDVSHAPAVVANSLMPPIPVVVSRLIFQEKAIKQADLLLGTSRIDEDGDLDVARRWPDRTYNVITLEHTLATPLSLVGLQVWSGALLLSDFILECGPEVLRGCTALELGSGTGLCSILASMFAEKVLCTDVGDEVLSLCQRNVVNNYHLSSRGRGSTVVPVCSPVLVRELDWQKDPFHISGPWSWQEDERLLAIGATVFLASDVIYSDELTDAFFNTIRKLFGSRTNCILFLSLEKRMNFTLNDLDIASPPYKHFKRSVGQLLLENSNNELQWIVRQMPTDFGQRFTYQRTKYLELWEISRR